MNKCTIISLRYIGTRHEELKTTAHECRCVELISIISSGQAQGVARETGRQTQRRIFFFKRPKGEHHNHIRVSMTESVYLHKIFLINTPYFVHLAHSMVTEFLYLLNSVTWKQYITATTWSHSRNKPRGIRQKSHYLFQAQCLSWEENSGYISQSAQETI